MRRNLKFNLLLLVVAVSILSCTEKYKKIDTKGLNNKIRSDTNIKTATDLIYAYDTTLVSRTASHAAKLSVISKPVGNYQFEIIAIVDVNDDDELKAEKIVMIAGHTKNLWKVFEIRYIWKNRDGYGHTDWGI